MNITKMLEMQNVLDTKIETEKKLTWTPEERFVNTVVALLTELAEFANEGRWFKVWSLNKEPNTYKQVECSFCWGTGDENYEAVQEDAEGNGGHEYITCSDCDGKGYTGDTNPLLEEYVDCVHYFLSLANQKGWQNLMGEYEEDMEKVRQDGLSVFGGLNKAFIEINYWLTKCVMDKEVNRNFQYAWFAFLSIGMIGFNLTPEQIEAEYLKKNKINHSRQKNGY